MSVKPFFEDSESSYFDDSGEPTKPGIYEFRRYDGMKILYTLDFMERAEDEAPRLKVVRCSRISEFPHPAHALNTLDGSWTRWLGPGETSADGEAPAGTAQAGASATDAPAGEASAAEAASGEPVPPT